MTVPRPTLLIACGALAREVLRLIEDNQWSALELQCLPADLHNKPKLIPELVRAKIRAAKQRDCYRQILVLYGDCGTGGMLDTVLQEEQVERIPGAHCYEFFATPTLFDDLSTQELGSFYLTDYLARFFDRLIIHGLGIDRHPELKDMYFAHYKRLVYLAQTDDPALLQLAKAAAQKLDLEFVHQKTGYGGLASFMQNQSHGPAPWHS